MCVRPHWQATELSQNKAPRPRCGRCLRPGTHCLCADIPSLRNHTHVLVLQHPDEARHPLNTARLAVLGLARAELLVGETFPQLAEKLAAAQRAV
ncbi:MAG: DTW domain-containing protein, partial [Alcaligenaceae bacterium]|nr:DTW domain-containing protein [Alcaligenaceae bacterium]